MTPAEQEEIFQSSLAGSLGDAPQEFVERVRARVQERITRTETPDRR